MNKKKTVIYATVLALFCASCTSNSNDGFINDVVVREDYASVYGAIGKQVTVDMVTEKEDGRAFVTLDNKEYELGMDFLSMAMVYNTAPTEKFQTSTAVITSGGGFLCNVGIYSYPKSRFIRINTTTCITPKSKA